MNPLPTAWTALLLAFGSAHADKLKPGESLDGQTFTIRNTLRLRWEAQAKAIESRYGSTDCKVQKLDEIWVVDLQRSADLMLYTQGRNLDPNEKIENGILFKPTSKSYETEVEAKTYASAHPEVYSIHKWTLNGRTLYSAKWHQKHDLVQKAREMLAAEIEKIRWLPFEQIGEFKRTDVELGGHSDGALAVGASYDQPGPDGKGAIVYVKRYENRPMTDHDVFRHLFFDDPNLLRWEIRTISGQTVGVFWNDRGAYLTWRLDDERAVEMMAAGGLPPEPIVTKYLELYPSVWKKDFAIDHLAWFAREGDLILAEMEGVLDAEQGEQLYDPYNMVLFKFYRWFATPKKWGLKDKFTPTERREHLKELRNWWTETGKAAGPRPDGPFVLDSRLRRRVQTPLGAKEEDK